MNLQKVIVLLVIALALFYVFTQPSQSAGAVLSALSWLRPAAEALITFVRNLFA